MRKFVILFLILSTQSWAQLNYPLAKQIPQTEIRFGESIFDPYKWMENHADPDLWSWVEEQKELTANYLDPNLMDDFSQRTLEFRKIKSEQSKVTEEVSFASSAKPFPDFEHKSMRRFVKWDSKSNFKANIFKKESALYDIKLQTVASGDLQRLIVTQKADNKLVDILQVKFFDFIAWADDQSFYYLSDLDQNMGGGKPGLFKHVVGEAQSEDVLLLSGKNANSNLVIHQVGVQFYAEVDDIIGTLQLSSGKLTNTHLIDGEIVEMSDEGIAEATVLSFKKANFGEFYKLRLRDGKREIFLSEQDFVFEKTKKLDEENTLVFGFKDSAYVVGVFKKDSTLNIIPLFDGTVDFVDYKDKVLKLGLESYSTPRTIYSFHVDSFELKELARQMYPVDVEARKIFYTASNGEKASMWVMTKKGIDLKPSTPLILYGYGGFRVSITPAFGIYESLSWLEKGGAFAVVTLPGSLDYGESWYQLARVGGRINSFDSFALAAKELFARGWTSPEHIGMMGASNGGTLTAGTLQRHSDIFKAAVPIVGVMDLLNFTLFTAGKYWMNDYGNPFVEADFRAIYPLSPYHNIQKREYPATMVMTAEFDDRVVPMHSYKYLARLQEMNTSNQPILLYHKEWGGHARASGSSKQSSRFVAAFYTFFSQQLGL